MRRMIGPSLVGVFGVVILITLGLWQMQRMGWKEAKLAAISAMLVDAPVDLPVQATSETDRYRGVMIDGAYTGEVALKLDSLQGQGPGKRVIAVFATQDGRRVLVDRGIWLDGTAATPTLAHPAQVLGNLDWPQEADSYTPPPDPKTGLWFARDVPAMAKALGAEQDQRVDDRQMPRIEQFDPRRRPNTVLDRAHRPHRIHPVLEEGPEPSGKEHRFGHDEHDKAVAQADAHHGGVIASVGLMDHMGPPRVHGGKHAQQTDQAHKRRATFGRAVVHPNDHAKQHKKC